MKLPDVHPVPGRPGFAWIDGGQPIGPNTVISWEHDRIKTKAVRAKAFAWLFWRLGGVPRCMIAVKCKGEPCDPAYLTFDHKNGRRGQHILGNLQPACPACNSWAQRHLRLTLESIHPRVAEQPTPAPKTSPSPMPAAYVNPRGYAPTSGETAASWEAYPKAVEYCFHPLTGRLRNLNDEIDKTWLVNNLPDIVGVCRSTTFTKYVLEWVQQGLLSESGAKGHVKLVRTGKSCAGLLERELGIRPKDAEETASVVESAGAKPKEMQAR